MNAFDFKLQPKTLLFVCGEEGFCRQTYLDGGNVRTWGFGLTARSGFDVLQYIRKNAEVSECVKQFIFVFNHYFCRVADILGHDASLEVLTGASSFHWNTGSIDKASWVHYFKDGDLEIAEKHFLEWDKPEYILARRKREADLIFRNKWDIQPCTEWLELTKSRHINWKSGIHYNILPVITKALNQ